MDFCHLPDCKEKHCGLIFIRSRQTWCMIGSTKKLSTFLTLGRTSKVSENQARRTVGLYPHRRIRVQGGRGIYWYRSTLSALVTSLGCDIRTKLDLSTRSRYCTTSEAHVKRPRAHAQESDISLVSFDQDDNFQCLSFK